MGREREEGRSMGFSAHGGRLLPGPSRSKQRTSESRELRQEIHRVVVPRTHRRRRPDRIRKACTLLACGWGFQSWRCTDGFASSSWRSLPKAAAGTTKRATATAARASSCATRSGTRSSGWQRPAPAAVPSRGDLIGDSYRRRRRTSGAIDCSQTEASTLEVYENGGGDTQLGGAAWVGDDDEIDEIGAAAAAAAAAAVTGDVDGPSEDLSAKRGKQRKQMNANVGRNKLFDLLNDLEGGGGGGLEAIELLGAETKGVSNGGNVLLDDAPSQGDMMVDLSMADFHRQQREDGGEGAPAEEYEGLEQEAAPLEPLKRAVRRKFLGRQGRVPPLTRSQAEEWRFLPMAENIQKIRRTKKTDPAIKEKWMEVMQVLRQVREEAGERGLGLTYIYHLGMRACLDFGHPEAVLQLFDELKAFEESPPNRQIFDAAVIAHCQLKQGDAAMEVIMEMKESGWVPTERAYLKVLETIRGTKGASVVANRVLRLYAEEDGLDIDGLLPRNLDFCHSYLMVLAWEHDWEQALSFFWQLVERGRPHPDPNCYNAVLYGLNKAERWEETARVMDNFRSQQRNQQFAPDARPTRSLYLSALSPLLKVAKRTEEDDNYISHESEAAMEEAMKVWKEFKDSGLYEGIPPHSAARLLHPLFNACDKHEKYWATALEAFELMETYDYDLDRYDEKWREADKPRRRGDKKNKRGGVAESGGRGWDNAEEEQTAPTPGEYRSMLHILSNIKDGEPGSNWERSMELLREAQENEYPISESSFHTVITDLGHAGEIDLAFSIYDDMRMAGISPSVNTYNRLLGVCEKNKEWERALKILDEMYEINLKPDIVSFGAAISACGKGLKWRRALALLVRMQHDGIEPNLQCFNAVIHGLGLSGEWKRAEAIMEVIHKTGLVPDGYTYNSMAMAYASAGESDQALDVLEIMESNGVQPDAVTYGTLMKACEGEGAFSIMRSLMDEMDQRGIPITVNHYTTCIDAANRMEGTGMGWELWRQMGVKGVEPNNYAYSAIITTAAIDRDVRTALRLLEEMKTKGMAIDVVSYTSAICACGPDWLLALDVLEEMEKDGVPPNLLSYTAAMGACFKGEEPREVINVFNRMKEAGVAPDLRAYNLAIMAHDADGNHYGRVGLEAELEEAGLSLQDKEWETAWVPPPELGGGFSEIGEASYDVGPPKAGGQWGGNQGSGGQGGYGQFEDYEAGGGRGHDDAYDDSW